MSDLSKSGFTEMCKAVGHAENTFDVKLMRQSWGHRTSSAQPVEADAFQVTKCPLLLTALLPPSS